VKHGNITFNQFAAVELRVGTVTRAEAFPEARNRRLNYGSILALRLALNKLPPQITVHYKPEEVLGKQWWVALISDPRRSRFYVRIFVHRLSDADGAVVLISPDRAMPNGAKLF